MNPVKTGSPVAMVYRISSTFSSVCSSAATPTTQSSERPYLTKAAGPSRNSPLPRDAPSTITPGPTALNQPSPCGLGGGGSSATFQGSSPVFASGVTVSYVGSGGPGAALKFETKALGEITLHSAHDCKDRGPTRIHWAECRILADGRI